MRFPSFLLAALVTLAPAWSNADAGADFEALLDEAWQWQLAAAPLFASRLGDRRYNRLWPDSSVAAIERRHQQRRAFLRRLYAIPRVELSDADQLNYELFRRELQTQVDMHRFRSHLLPFNQRGGV